MANNQGLPPIKKNALDERRLALYAKKQEGAKGAPKFTVSVMANNPRFTVFTNDNSNTILRAKMDASTFMAVLMEMIDLPDKEPGYTCTWRNMTGAPTNMVEDSRTTVGKNNQGVCFITVYKNDGGDRIIFPFLPSMYHKVFGPDGELEPADVSAMYVKAWGKLLTELVPNILDSQYVEAPPYQQNRKDGGYNRNNSSSNTKGNGNDFGNSQGGGSQGGPSDSGFDDFDGLPM